MRLQRFDLNLLKALNAVLIERNVTRAGHRLFLSQPAMSNALKRLREELNDELLVRVGREMELTPLGRILSRSVPELLRSIQHVLDTELCFDPETVERTFDLAISDYAAAILLPAVLERLKWQAPRITFNLRPVDDSTFGAIWSGDIDLFIGVPAWKKDAARIDGDLLTKLLFTDDFACVISANHPQVGETLDIIDYGELQHGVVRFSEQSETLAESALREAGLAYRVGLTAPNFVSLLLLLPHTWLVATVPRRLAKLLSVNLSLRVLDCPMAMPRLEEALVWHPHAAIDPAHGYIRSVLIECAASLSEGGFG